MSWSINWPNAGIVKAQIAVDEGQDKTGGWQLLAGDWNARQTDTWCIPIKIVQFNYA